MSLHPRYFSHPLLKANSVLFRQYQNVVVQKTFYTNSLIVVPTSLGKTIIALLICIDILFKWKKSKILFLSPTRPLVNQHLDLFKRFSKIGNLCFALTGKISPVIRKTIWESSSIRMYFATPELVKNDLDDNYLKMDEFFLVIFDEAHRAVKNYSYTGISRKFYKSENSNSFPMFLALSASPGSNEEKIQEICTNLFMEQIIVKSEDDADVLPYVYNIEVIHNYVELDEEHKNISSILQSLINEKIKWLLDNKFIKKKRIINVYRKDLLNLSENLKIAISQSNHTNFLLYAALRYQTMSMILLYCRDLVESQGNFALKKFLDQFNGDESQLKSYQDLLSDSRMKEIIDILKYDNSLFSHPKISNTLLIVKDFLFGDKNIFKDDANSLSKDIKSYETEQMRSNGGIDTDSDNKIVKKVLIFSQYRDTLDEIVIFLNQNGIKCRGFYGHANKKNQKGFSQDEQLSILSDFKKGKFHVLAATSVAEEGLDIPNVDLVIFYEPVVSEIRFIQRKGRTGRFSNGKVIVLITNDSIDSKYLSIVQRKISKMKQTLKKIHLDFNKYDKKLFQVTNEMDPNEIDALDAENKKIVEVDEKQDENYLLNSNENDFFNPIVNAISSNSNKKIKYFIKNLSYRTSRINTPGYPVSGSDMEHLYNASLALDNQKLIYKAQRKIYELLVKSGKGLNISELSEEIGYDQSIISNAIKNLEKLKKIKWINKNTISIIDSIKNISGKKYSIFVEKILIGKAIVLINGKWFASLNYFDYLGSRHLLKKGNSFDVIGEIYKKNDILCLSVKKII